MIHFISILIILAASLATAQPRGADLQKSSSVSENQFFGVGIGHASGYYVDFSSARLSSVGGNSKVISEFESAPVLELDMRIIPKNSLYGLRARITIDFEHKNKSTTINGVNSNTSVFEGSKLAFYTLEGSLAGRFERFFVLVGGNYSIANFSASPNFSGVASMKGGNNTHLGMGYYVSDNFAVELMLWRRKTVKFSTTTSSGIEDSYGSGEAVTSTVALKYFSKLIK